MTGKKKKTFLQFLHIHTLIDVAAVVLVWRGIWMLFDLYLLPDNPIVSALVSIGVGLTILYIEDSRFDELK